MENVENNQPQNGASVMQPRGDRGNRQRDGQYNQQQRDGNRPTLGHRLATLEKDFWDYRAERVRKDEDILRDVVKTNKDTGRLMDTIAAMTLEVKTSLEDSRRELEAARAKISATRAELETTRKSKLEVFKDIAHGSLFLGMATFLIVAAIKMPSGEEMLNA